MKKKIILLILALIMIPITKVNGAGTCGYAYVSSSGGYQEFYEQGSNGYCGPSRRYIEKRGGYSEDKYYNKFEGVKCTYYDCRYYYIHPTQTRLADIYASQTNFPTKKIFGAYGIKLHYDYPQAKNKFKTANGKCLQQTAGGKSTFWATKGRYYLIDSSRGYKIVNDSECKNSSSSYTGSDYMKCTSDYLQNGCNNSYVKTMKTRLKEIGKDKTISACSSMTVNTSYDSATVSCVKAYQSSKSELDVDGIAGPKTLSAINDDYKALQEKKAKQLAEENAEKETEEAKENAKQKAITYYTVTYDTDGGHFANGESKRNVVYGSYEKVIYPGTPGKDGYKFLGWYNGDLEYSFDSEASANLTLTAKWEAVETTLYCNSDNDVLDVDTGQCTTVETFEKDGTNITENKFYVVTPGILQTIRTKSTFKRNCNKYLYNIVPDTEVMEGSNNTVTCGNDLNYVRDTWRAEETCFVGTYCEDDSSKQVECIRTWRGTCYATYDASEDSGREITDNDDSDNGTGLPEEDTNTTDGGKPSQEDVDKSPDTGNALILVAWTIGLGALGYSIYWFQKRREEL